MIDFDDIHFGFYIHVKTSIDPSNRAVKQLILSLSRLS